MIFRRYYTRDPLVLKTEYLRPPKIYNWYGGYKRLPFYDVYNGNWFVHSEFVELYYSRDHRQVYVRLLKASAWLGDKGVAGSLPENGHLEMRSKDRHHFESGYRNELRGRITIEVRSDYLLVALSHGDRTRQVVFRASDRQDAQWLHEWS
jgi:hypothetical protein